MKNQGEESHKVSLGLTFRLFKDKLIKLGVKGGIL